MNSWPRPRLQLADQTQLNLTMETMARDLRHALRDLAATPGFTIVVVLMLALGIGANVAVFSVVNGVLLRALPYEHAERLVAIWEVDTRMTPVEYRNPVSVGNFGDWREQRDVFEHVAAFTWWSDAIFSGQDGPEKIRSGRVSAGFFETLRVQPSIGRVFLSEEDQPARRHVTVLSHAFWQRSLGGEPNVIGRVVRLDDLDYTVVGVLPAGCDLLSAGVEAWTPMGLPASDFQNRKSHWMRVIARLKPGVTIERAQAQMTTVAEGIRQAYPQWISGQGPVAARGHGGRRQAGAAGAPWCGGLRAAHRDGQRRESSPGSNGEEASRSCHTGGAGRRACSNHPATPDREPCAVGGRRDTRRSARHRRNRGLARALAGQPASST